MNDNIKTLTSNVRVLNDIVEKKITELEYSNYLKVKDLNLPILKPIDIKKIGTSYYFYYKKYNFKEPDKESILNSLLSIKDKTKQEIPIPKIAEFKFKKIAVILNERFKRMEMMIREIELKEYHDDVDWIFLSKYHILLDSKIILYKLIKKLLKQDQMITSCVLHGCPTKEHYLNDSFIGYKRIYEGYYVNDIYKLYLDFFDQQEGDKDILDKYLLDDYAKRYFKLMIIYSYILMLSDIDFTYENVFKYINITNKIARILKIFKDYK